MSKMFLGPSSKIQVGLALNEMDDSLIEAAGAIADRTGMTTRLFHALEPFFEECSSRHVPLSAVFEETADLVQNERHRAAMEKLTKRVEQLPNRVERELAVVAGDACDALMTDARFNYARITVVGTGRLGKHAHPGFTIASRLLAESTVPILVVPSDFHLKAAPARLRILIADDLSAACESAVRAGLQLARAIGNADVIHTHVNGVTADRLTQLLQAAASTIGSSDAIAIDTLDAVAAAEHSLGQQVSHRATVYAEQLATRGGTYLVEILSGTDPVVEIEELARRMDADIIVFGRNRAAHQSPFRLGHVPFQAMMRQERAIMVVPMH